MLDYQEMADLENTLIKDIDPEIISELKKELSHLVAHTAVTAIHQAQKIIDPEAEMDFSELANLENTILKDIDQRPLDHFMDNLVHLIAHTSVTAAHQTEKLTEENN